MFFFYFAVAVKRLGLVVIFAAVESMFYLLPVKRGVFFKRFLAHAVRQCQQGRINYILTAESLRPSTRRNCRGGFCRYDIGPVCAYPQGRGNGDDVFEYLWTFSNLRQELLSRGNVCFKCLLGFGKLFFKGPAVAIK